MGQDLEHNREADVKEPVRRPNPKEIVINRVRNLQLVLLRVAGPARAKLHLRQNNQRKSVPAKNPIALPSLQRTPHRFHKLRRNDHLGR